MKRELATIIGIIISIQVLSQSTFTNYNTLLPTDVNTLNSTDGCGVSMLDFDGDGWDDLSFTMAQGGARFFKNENGSFSEVDFGIEGEDNGKMVTWIDFDNDGDKDLFLTHRYSRCRLFRNDDGILTEISDDTGFPQDTDHLTTGAAWADYDKDGLLDVYICNFNSPFFNDVLKTNYLYRNLGDGTFEDVTLAADVANSSQQTFQAVWFDYNNDDWPDMYVINDRTFHKNSLYRNNGDGTFTDQGTESGTDISIYAMSATSFDYNSDGFQDLYITNGIEGNAFFHNNGDGTFSNIAQITGTSGFSICWAASILDHDNSGQQDIHVAVWAIGFPSQQNHFWSYEGGLIFDYNTETFLDDLTQGYSAAVGDINNDGFFDLVMHNDAPNNASLWQNDGNDNHFIKFKTEGTISNRDGVGTLVVIESDGEAQYRYTKCGEDYLTQNSACEIVGLGQDTIVEQITLTWPSGLIENYFDLPVDSTYHFIEGNSFDLSINTPQTSICPGETATLTSNLSDVLTWSTGSTAPTIQITSADTISFIVEIQGMNFFSDTLIISEIAAADVLISSSDLLCWEDQSGTIGVESTNEVGLMDILMNDLLTNLPIDSLSGGIYELAILDDNGCEHIYSVTINEPDSLIAEAEVSSPTCFGLSDGTINISGFGGTLPYSIDSLGLNFSQIPAGTYNLTLLDSNLCSAAVIVEVSEPEELSLELTYLDDIGEGGSADATATGGSGSADLLWSTGSVDWSIDGLEPGEYWATVTDSLGCSDSASFTILDLSIAQYSLATLRIFPVPSTGKLSIESPVYFLASIHDQMGRKVIELVIENGLNIIDFTGLEAGIYFITENEKASVSIKPTKFILIKP